MREFEAGCAERGRNDSLSGEEQRISQLTAEEQLWSEGRHGQQRRTTQHLAHDCGEVRIRHGRGSSEVHRTLHVRSEQMFDGGNFVVDGNPTLPLVTTTELSAQSCTEEWKLLLERTTLGGEHDAGAKQHGAHIRTNRCVFPLLAYIGEKPCAASGSFVQWLIATSSVKTDCRTREKHRWTLGRTCNH